MNTDELKRILDECAQRLESQPKALQNRVERLRNAISSGVDALSDVDLSNADLRDADLSNADLHGANLRSASLRSADLSNADLRDADLSNADLHGANLRSADLLSVDLRGANLLSVDLRGANLLYADLRRANLQYADLRNADLYGANLCDADLRYSILTESILDKADLTGALLPDFQIPQHGELRVYKKVQDRIVHLLIPPTAKRTASLIGRKCRAEYAKVLAIQGDWGVTTRGVTYRIGKTVYPDSYDDDPRLECTHGIHFFLTRKEAEDY